MKKITLLMSLFIAFAINAQEVYYSEDFSDENVTDDWTLLDEDGDGANWSRIEQIVDEDNNPVAGPLLRSNSYDNQNGALTPDNWAITPAIDLSEEDGSEEITLTWEVSAADADYADENYTVYVATANGVSDFTASDISYNEVVTDNGPGGIDNVYTKTLDITDMAGESEVYVAFRHHDVTDEFTMEIHSVEVYAGTLSNTSFENNEFTHYVNNSGLHIAANTTLQNVEIFNISGKRVLQNEANNKNVTVNISDLASGIYIAKVQTENGRETFKFSKK
ncbi:MAG: choice-of-anchor J domain-containing protein [Bacteroidota bacterium]